VSTEWFVGNNKAVYCAGPREREEITWNWRNEHSAEFLNYILHHVKWTLITESGQMGGTYSRNENVEKLMNIFLWKSEGNTVKYTYNGTATDRIFCCCMQVPFNAGTGSKIKNPRHWTFLAEDGLPFCTGSF